MIIIIIVIITTPLDPGSGAREFREPGLGYFSAQFLWKFCGESRRFAETDIFPCRMTNEYCGDLRRRRMRATTVQNDIKSWLVKFPTLELRTPKGHAEVETGSDSAIRDPHTFPV